MKPYKRWEHAVPDAPLDPPDYVEPPCVEDNVPCEYEDGVCIHCFGLEADDEN